jgi:hypothetical protein
MLWLQLVGRQCSGRCLCRQLHTVAGLLPTHREHLPGRGELLAACRRLQRPELLSSSSKQNPSKQQLGSIRLMMPSLDLDDDS